MSSTFSAYPHYSSHVPPPASFLLYSMAAIPSQVKDATSRCFILVFTGLNFILRASSLQSASVLRRTIDRPMRCNIETRGSEFFINFGNKISIKIAVTLAIPD